MRLNSQRELFEIQINLESERAGLIFLYIPAGVKKEIDQVVY